MTKIRNTNHSYTNILSRFLTWVKWDISPVEGLTCIEAGGGGAKSRMRRTHSHQPLRGRAGAAGRAVTLTRRHDSRWHGNRSLQTII